MLALISRFIAVLLLLGASSFACEEYSELERENEFDVFGDAYDGWEPKQFTITHQWENGIPTLQIYLPGGGTNNLSITDSAGTLLFYEDVFKSDSVWNVSLSLNQLPRIPATVNVFSVFDLPTGKDDFARSQSEIPAPTLDLSEINFQLECEIGYHSQGAVQLLLNIWTPTNHELLSYPLDVTIRRSDMGLIFSQQTNNPNSRLWTLDQFTDPATVQVSVLLDTMEFKNAVLHESTAKTMGIPGLNIINNWALPDGQLGPGFGGTSVEYPKSDNTGNWLFLIDNKGDIITGHIGEIWVSATIDGEYIKVREHPFGLQGYVGFEASSGVVFTAFQINHRNGLIPSPVINGNERHYFFKIRTVFFDWDSGFSPPRQMIVTEEPDKWRVEVISDEQKSSTTKMIF